MKRRLAYPIGLILAAGKCDRDAARTPYAAAKEQQRRGVQPPVRIFGRRYLPRTLNGEGLLIALNNRSWL